MVTVLTEAVGCCSPLIREPLSAGQAVEFSQLFKAMGDPVRLCLRPLIASHAGGETCVCDLTGVFELTEPTISHHLKVLREAGLISGQRRGTRVSYRVHPEALGHLSAVLVPGAAAVGSGNLTSTESGAADSAVVSKLSTSRWRG